jgi:hypothetical protein
MTATPALSPHHRICCCGPPSTAATTGPRTSERAALVAHLLGLGAGFAAIIGLIPPVTTLVRMLID